jgi:hypothetical protein
MFTSTPIGSTLPIEPFSLYIKLKGQGHARDQNPDKRRRNVTAT